MTLQELVGQHAQRAQGGVPDWMLGYFKRHSISFANGLSDSTTHVCWLQSRSFTIDLRLPVEQGQPPARALADYSDDELQVLANYEGWEALSEWDGQALTWHSETALQLHTRYPEPALLHRVGNCMIEFAPSGAYVEDWRLQPSAPGPLIGLRLIEEQNLDTGEIRHCGGGLIVCGDYAALVLGRSAVANGVSLRDEVAKAGRDTRRLSALFNFETSVAAGDLDTGFEITLSTRAGRLGKPLFPLDGFEYLPEQNQVMQLLEFDGVRCRRLFTIDTLESTLPYNQATGFTPESEAWYSHESPALTRYTAPLY